MSAMASPLSPAQNATLNFSTPQSSRRFDSRIEVKTTFVATAPRGSSPTSTPTNGVAATGLTSAIVASPSEDDGMVDTPRDPDAGSSSSSSSGSSGSSSNPGSSPFVHTVNSSDRPESSASVHSSGQENSSPSKKRHSRIMSGAELSPLKILGDAHGRTTSSGSASSDKPGTPFGHRKVMASERRFPVRISSPRGNAAASNTSAVVASTEATPKPPSAFPFRSAEYSLEEAVKQTSELVKAIDIFEDDEDDMELETTEAKKEENAERRRKKEENNEDKEEEEEGGEEDGGGLLERDRDHGGEEIGRLEDEDENEEDDGSSVVITRPRDDTGDGGDLAPVPESPEGVDDSVMSTFSTFSAVPNMTMFAKLGHTPAKVARPPPDSSSPAARPRPISAYEPGNTTNLLVDFTEQLRHPQRSPARRHNPSSPSRGAVPGPGDAMSTPTRPLGNLIDFDIPPLPTPRSIPTITPRELESLKSGFLSEISSLKASLSGKEAEVQSLKTAVGDAEKRVGECMEQVREERANREHLEAEKESWEGRGREMESVLRKIRDEIVMGQREREELESKLEENDKRREAAEMMAQEAESKMAGLRAGKAAEDKEREARSADKPRSPASASSTAREVEQAVERVARELHALYKSKHETKVAALKKSYEARWEKRVRELEARLDVMGEENDRLRVGRDASLSRVGPSLAAEEERKAQAARDAAQIKELAADVDRLEAVTKEIRRDNEEMRGLLERERVEKGELVQLAEEMMSMQSFVQTSAAAAAAAAAASASASQNHRANINNGTTGVPAVAATPARGPAANARHSMMAAMPSPGRTTMTGAPTMAAASSAATTKTPGRLPAMHRAPTSGLRAPPESRIGRGPVAHERNKSSAAGGLPRPQSGIFAPGMRSGIMSSIEKMGSRGRGD